MQKKLRRYLKLIICHKLWLVGCCCLLLPVVLPAVDNQLLLFLINQLFVQTNNHSCDCILVTVYTLCIDIELAAYHAQYLSVDSTNSHL